jgi:hypothetical protein
MADNIIQRLHLLLLLATVSVDEQVKFFNVRFPLSFQDLHS